VPEYEGKMYGHLKTDVADAVVALLEPIQQRYTDLRDDRAELDRIMRIGADKAREKAAITLTKVYDAVGFVPRPL
jgi:tryptophanyl-tRNA synthetase